MAGNLDLSATLQLNDLISAPMRKIAQQAKTMQQAMSDTKKTVQQMQSTLNNANAYSKVAQSLRQVQAQIRQTANAERTLAAAVAASVSPTQRQIAALERLRNTMTSLDAKQSAYRAKMSELGRSLQQAGFNTKQFAQSQAQISERMQSANASIERQRAELTRLSTAQKAAAAATKKYEAAQARASELKSGGMGAAMAGVGMGMGMEKSINEAKHFQTETARIASLGLGDVATNDAVKYAQAMKTYGTSTTENLTLIRDGMTAFADEGHAKMVAPMLAKMKFANEAMYGQEQGGENERKLMDMLKVIEVRGGTKSEAAFSEQANAIQQVITATGGRVGADDWMQVIKTGGLAAKLMENKAFYQTLEPLVQEQGGGAIGTGLMSSYQNLYQGRTTKRAANNLDNLGLIGDKSKVKYDKAGQTAQLDIGALKGADLFKKNQFDWMEKVLVPQLNSKGITKDSDVIDAIGSIFSNRKAGDLMANMYLQRSQIHKSQKLNSGADDIDQLNDKAKGTASGQELDAKAKMHDALLQLGTSILPTYTAALQAATAAMQGLASFMQTFPTLTKGIAVGLLAIAAGLTVFGGMAIVIGSVLGPIALLRVAITRLGGISGMLGSLVTAFNVLRTAIMGISAATLLSPIGLAIMGIALLAGVLIMYWQPIKAFFTGLWQGISAGLAPAVAALKAAFAPLAPILSSLGAAFTSLLSPIQFSASALLTAKAAGFAVGTAIAALVTGIIAAGTAMGTFAAMVVVHGGAALSFVASLPGRFMAFLAGLPAQMSAMGGQIMDGLKNGIMSRVASVVSSIASVASSIKSAFTGAMDIHSPSRVFAGYGDFMMQGLNNGLVSNTSPLQSMIKTSDQLKSAMDTSQIRFDSRSPIAGNMANGGMAAQAAAPITINIYPQANQSPTDIAQLVASELAKAKMGQNQSNTALYDHAEAW